MSSIVDLYCPYVHESPITSASYEAYNQTKAIADQAGNIAVYRGSTKRPMATFLMDASVEALSITPQGHLLVAGDNQGSIVVFDLNTTAIFFEERREGARGQSRAFRAVAISPTGTMLAAIAVDGILRIWNLRTGERQNYRGFVGSSLEFDARGERLLVIGEDKQPKLFHLQLNEIHPLDKAFTSIEHVRFTKDYQYIFAAGAGGFVLYQTSSLQVVNGKAAQKSSGILSIQVSPSDNNVAAFSKRSIYLMTTPDLEIYEQFPHKAPKPSNSSVWDHQGIWIGGGDGIMHSKSSSLAVPATHYISGKGNHRVSCHNNVVAIFKKDTRTHLFSAGKTIKEASLSRNGEFLVLSFYQAPIQAYQLKTGKMLLQAPAETQNPKAIWCTPNCIAIELENGGGYWWSFKTNLGMQIQWARNITLTNGGNWLGTLTPEGRIQIIDCHTGKRALPDPQPTSQAEIQKISFLSKSSKLVALDADGYLICYDLSKSGVEGAVGKDIMQINTPVKRLWGIQQGDFAVLELGDDTKSQLLYLDLSEQQDPQIIEDLSPALQIDNITGQILQPAKCSSILQYSVFTKDNQGQLLQPNVFDAKIYRNLPNQEWIIFRENSIIAISDGANDYLN